MIQIRPYTAPHSLRQGMLAYAEGPSASFVGPLQGTRAGAASTTASRAAATDDVLFIGVDTDDPAPDSTATTSTGGGPSDDGDTPGALLPGAKRMPTRQGGQSTVGDPLPTFSLEGELHDESLLPHLHSNAEIKRMLPETQAAPIQPDAEDWIPAPTEIKENKNAGALRPAEITVNEGMGGLLSRQRIGGKWIGGTLG